MFFGGEQKRRDFGVASVCTILRTVDALPLVVAVNKTEGEPGPTVATRKGGVAVDQESLLYPMLGKFSGFLQSTGRRGAVRMDQLSGLQEQRKWQSHWSRRREQFSGLHAVDEKLEFVDSEKCPEVQIADSLLGLIRYTDEHGSSQIDGLASYLEDARTVGLGVLWVK